jgi:hypothetical protein
MAEVARVGPDEAHQKVETGEAILVCAYDDREKCRQLHLEGAIDLDELQAKLPAIPKEKELIFYCA